MTLPATTAVPSAADRTPPSAGGDGDRADTSDADERPCGSVNGRGTVIPLPYHLPGGDSSAAAREDWDGPSTSAASAPSPSTSSASALSELPATIDENGHSYVGLVNQAMTCYLNSLVQTLFMTPEFRNAMFRWQYTGERAKEERSIPYQLQKLFLLLQTTEKSSLETKSLTKSFGWDTQDAWDQHDVQELCRVMFDALESRWKQSKRREASLIQDLYRGSVKDYVKCLACGRENAREDIFLDLPLAVKPFGVDRAFGSVEEALAAFVQPELLDGQNQYDCEHCQEKTDAHKGLKVTKFPYLLTIQLKRFDFDYNTLRRVKLNDSMSFPDLLNLNPFVAEGGGASTATSDDDDAMETDTQSDGDDDALAPRPLADEDVDEGISLNGSTRSSPAPAADAPAKGSPLVGFVDVPTVEALLQQGPFIYELFSIMVHSGSANGGHYYAYIKNVVQDRWFCFNDTSVRAATIEDLRRAFGGTSGGWHSGSTNAYMLMYRQIDRNRNDHFIQTAELPSHLRDLLVRLDEEAEVARREVEQREAVLSDYPVFYQRAPSEKRCCLKIDLHKTMSVGECLRMLQEMCERPSSHVDDLVSAPAYRLVLFNGAEDSPAFYETLDDPTQTLGQVLKEYSQALYLERGGPHETFQPIPQNSHGIVLCMQILNESAVELLPGPWLWVPQGETIAAVKAAIAERFNTNSSDIRVVRNQNSSSVLDDSASILDSWQFCPRNMKVFVDVGFDSPVLTADRPRTLEQSRFGLLVEAACNRITVKVKLPSADDFRLAGLPLPAYLPGDAKTAGGSASSTEWMSYGNGGLNKSPDGPSGGLSEVDTTPTPACSPSASPAALLTPDTSPQVSPSSPSPSPLLADEGMATAPASVGDDVADSPSSSSGGTVSSAPTAIIAAPLFAEASLSTESVGYSLRVLVDGRQSIGDFKTALADWMVVPMADFSLRRSYSGTCPLNVDKTLRDSTSTGYDDLTVELGEPLSTEQRRLRVRRFSLAEPDEKWPDLLYAVVDATMTASECLDQCVRHLNRQSANAVPIECCRLRKICNRAVTLMADDKKLVEFTSAVYGPQLLLQVLPGADAARRYSDASCVFVRRWSPATLDLAPPFEAIVRATDAAAQQAESLVGQIAQQSGLPVERIEMSKAVTGERTFPYAVERLRLLDGEVSFYGRDDEQLAKMQQILCGQIVYFRDSSELPRQLSAEERRAVTAKDGGDRPITFARQKERALRIREFSTSVADDVDVD